ncbi:CsbD family protein [Rhodoblastus sp.]|uniref:CsbD family protein n=1 Tax=Rhodoblastus sp. TaxID=1962975 RepID=UPI003F97B65A
MTENAIMTTSKTDKIKGAANEMAGKVKQGVGSATGDDNLRAKGAAQELKGSAQKAGGAAKDTVKKAVDKA